jgi:hypothetical protein
LWSSGDGFIENLKLLLGLSDLPAAPDATEHSQDLIHQGECAICFMARLEGELPSRACDNEKCGMAYHVACLFQVHFIVFPNRHGMFISAMLAGLTCLT